MKVVTLAAGLAVGYVLGSRAGREKYEQIVASVHKVSGQPSVVKAQDKAKELVSAGTDAVTAKLAEVNPETTTAKATPRPARRKPAVTPPGVTTAPLA
jgi:hypothetical protein